MCDETSSMPTVGEDLERSVSMYCATPVPWTSQLERSRSGMSGLSSRRSTQLLRRSSSSLQQAPFLVRTFQVSLVPPEQLTELQCSVCSKLIKDAVHAPCGYTFCKVHLDAGSDAYHQLESQAAAIRELVVNRGFSVHRAREALGVAGKGDLERAVELCASASGIETHAVRVRSTVKVPEFQWGNVTPESLLISEPGWTKDAGGIPAESQGGPHPLCCGAQQHLGKIDKFYA